VVPSLYLEIEGDSTYSSGGVSITDFAPSGCNIIGASAMSLYLLKLNMALPPPLEVSPKYVGTTAMPAPSARLMNWDG
jgi:hypothetical protein